MSSLLLSIETSSPVCSAALFADGKLAAFSEVFVAKSHSAVLTVLIEDLLKYAGAEISDLTAVALSEGPGSYTGLRIGTSVAKGICFGRDIPLLPVSTLAAEARQAAAAVAEPAAVFCPMIDARRMDVYTAFFDSEGKQLAETRALTLSEALFEEFSGRPVYYFGDGAAKAEAVFRGMGARHLPGIYPSARFVGELALQSEIRPADLASYEPFYLKNFQAIPAKKIF